MRRRSPDHRRRSFVVERRGRPRKSPLAPAARAPDVRAIAAAMPHRRAVHVAALRHDARAETQLGILALNGEISDDMYRAGVLLRDCVRRFHAATGIPAHDRGALPLDGARSGAPREMSEAAVARAKDQHARITRLVIETVGVGGAQQVMHLVVFDVPPQKAAIGLHRKCLDVLAEYFGLRRGRKTGQNNKR